MPKNVMKLIKPNPHRGRNDFDLSHRHVYTLNFGELRPATCLETVPGDHIKVDIANLVRAMPMVTSPFMRAKQHFDCWFVPYRDLWHNFDWFLTRRGDFVSSALKSPLVLPQMKLSDIVVDLLAASQLSKTDVVGRSLATGCGDIFNLLGYGHLSAPSAGEIDPYLNPFRAMAYQYIWYKEYRNDVYDEGSLNIPTSALSMSNVACLFNADVLQCTDLSKADLHQFGNDYYAALFQKRYRCWKKDLYTGQLPSTQFGAVSSAPSTNLLSRLSIVDASGNVFSGIHALSAKDGSGVVSSAVLDGNAPSQYAANSANIKAGSLNSSMDVLALRKATALQIWRENALRAGNRTADNMLAHYGVKSDFRDHRPTYIGSIDAPLNIGDVDATAQTGSGTNQNLGSVVGKGLSSLAKKAFEFDAKDFGVIMVMHSILPEAEYNSNGIDRMNQLLEPEDFFTPEYENIGLEAVSISTFYRKYSNIMGYAPRYYGYKTKLDKCFGELQTGGSLSPWCSPRADVDQILSLSIPTAYPLRNLYVDPRLFDVNFSVGLNSSEQFICDTYFEVDAVRPMSVMGLPNDSI